VAIGKEISSLKMWAHKYDSYIQAWHLNQLRYHVPHNNSILQFNSLLFMCRVNSYKANYRHSTA
jgi:hypothetical protein